ncbi:thermosome subunit [Candidatus Micrarchaeota archaeon CG08_land_8_20_14_0_20_49_17]|nr:MAG: thermosome subunit [Candidatus Micrarchaeota archaeon CG1_02_49_24]PIU09225.1 MAG: thermosome subunit [Candidatus Micrarchaeota archaeon CG08_land_8_20_14_0_20_49_17]PIU82559.1 MAG: thermosome subunit [Candidatus Micrarchaeota archaeon CG06_land_8_20_14_3_00_50_6]HII53850.1 thermosome subunit [Candidatus Micrarchaeota archaeon]
MSNKLEGQQVLVLPEGSSRVLGRDAQRTNIAIAYAVANVIRTTLGPKGMDKMLVSELGDIVITNDGATILEEMNVEHPTAKLLVEVAKTQDKEVGDGTTTAAMLTGMLLKKAGDLLDQGIHPSIIIRGYDMAAKECIAALDKISKPVTLADTEILLRIAEISMGSKAVGVGEGKSFLAGIVVKAVTQVAEKDGKTGSVKIDAEFIKIEKKAGGDIKDTTLINGVLIDKEVVHQAMPKKAEKAKIALIDCALEIEKTEIDAKIEITSPDQMQAFLNQEEKMLKDMVGKVTKSGASVLFCQKGIDDVAQHYLAKAGIMAVRRVKKSDMDKLARATGAQLVTTLDDLSESQLGYVGIVEERKIAGEQMIFIEECKHPKSVTLLIRASTDHVVNEGERAIKDGIGAVRSVIEDGKYVTGGGSIEMELSKHLQEFAAKTSGREQLAIQAFAETLEWVPRTLAENCGIDAIDALVSLRSKHKEGKATFGVEVYSGTIDDVAMLGVLEPAKIKKQAIQSAYEAAKMILRIDDMISSRARAPSAPPGGMGGMGDMD